MHCTALHCSSCQQRNLEHIVVLYHPLKSGTGLCLQWQAEFCSRQRKGSLHKLLLANTAAVCKTAPHQQLRLFRINVHAITSLAAVSLRSQASMDTVSIQCMLEDQSCSAH
jgi:hypothetical protein